MYSEEEKGEGEGERIDMAWNFVANKWSQTKLMDFTNIFYV